MARETRNTRKKRVGESTKKGGKLKYIPLGGLGQIGKNLHVFEYEDSILVVACGLMFPDDEMLGIDFVIPEISYLVENKEKIVDELKNVGMTISRRLGYVKAMRNKK